MMREVTGAFCGPRKLDEALEDLRAEGIAGDRIRVACVEPHAEIQMSIALSASSPTQWITAEHAGYAPYSNTTRSAPNRHPPIFFRTSVIAMRPSTLRASAR